MNLVLDPCCGSRMWWFNPANDGAIYGDVRSESVTVPDRSMSNGARTITVTPQVMMDFRELPFAADTFRLVAFDPPHLTSTGPRSWMRAKYGTLSAFWRDDLRRGFSECLRVLKPEGVLIFKWSEVQVQIAEVLALAPATPLFGNTSGKQAGTHFMVFMKPAELTAQSRG